MKLSIKEVEKIANLARLGLSKEEKDKFAEQLSSILDYFKQLEKINTDGVEPTAQVTDLDNVMRKDVIQGCDKETRDGLLKNAPAAEDDLVKTGSVFE